MFVELTTTAPVGVERLGFGSGPLGSPSQLTDAEAVAVVDAAWDEGIRAFDTAPSYGSGLAEQRLGLALARRPRDQYAISTKVGRLSMANPDPYVPGAGVRQAPYPPRARFDFSAEGVRASIEGSLQRLGVEHLDAALLHDPEQHLNLAIGEGLPALRDLREEGLVRAIGVGTTSVAAALRLLREPGIDVMMLATRWTLADRTGQLVLDQCAERGVAVHAAAPFNSGLLASEHPTADRLFDYRPATVDKVQQALAFAEACNGHGAALPQAALQFALRHPAVERVVAGMGKVTDVRADAQAMREPVPEELWERLDELTLLAAQTIGPRSPRRFRREPLPVD